MRANLAGTLLLALAAARAGVAAADAPRGFLGLSAVTASRMPALPEGSGGPYPAALEVALVWPGSPGASAGVRVGDFILAVDGQPFDPAQGDPATQYRTRLNALAPGARVELTVLERHVDTRVVRDGAALDDPSDVVADLGHALDALPGGGRLQVDASRQESIVRLPVVLGTHPFDQSPARPVPSDEEIHPGLAAMSSSLETFGTRAIDHFGLAKDTDDLRARLARLAGMDDGFHLDDVRFVQRNPWHVALVAADVLGGLAPLGDPPDLAARIRAAAARDRTDFSAVAFAPLPRAGGVDVQVAALEALLAETAALRAVAFQDLTPDERAFLAAHVDGLAGALAESGYLHDDPNPARRRDDLRIVEISKKVRRDALYVAALSWARLADGEWLSALQRDLVRDPRAAQEYVIRKQTPQGEIVVGGTGRNRYRDFEPAIVVDLGGDDVYSDNAGSSSFEARPCAAVIDLGGDDAYEATADGAQGSGIGGVGLLVDAAGNDRYVAPDFSQAAGVLGVGALVDLGGDDTYRLRHCGQGLGLWGAGFLLDLAGEDRYDGLMYVQGVGLPGGFGVLHDGQGDDRYYAKGGAPTGYGTQGVFDAWSQGCGFGFRTLEAGGIGVLADESGADDYEAGNFAQGGGYYFGWGLLHDRGREGDSYVGSRYDQGFAAHEALGTFIDEGGDDRYMTRDGVIAGLAWDECVTYFLDRGGNDVYEAGGFSLGASAHNSFCFFVDADGSDRYEGADVARAGGNDYHGGTSLSLFLDLGRGRDDYPVGPREGTIEASGEHSVAADLPGTIESASGVDFDRIPAPGVRDVAPGSAPARPRVHSRPPRPTARR